jgi:AraC-like DNA-binding protein
MVQIRTRDLEEAIQSVGQVYCPHSLRLDPHASALDTTLAVSGPASQPLVHLSYGAPVMVDAGNFPGLFLVMRCNGGDGRVRQGRSLAEWQVGRTLLVSANQGTDFAFGRDFSQTTIKLDSERLAVLCARFVGHPLGRDIRFDLSPFSDQLERVWAGILALLTRTDPAQALPSAAAATLEEFVLTLLLHSHRHNFSSELERPVSEPRVGLVREAETYIESNADSPITVSEVAALLNVSIRTLQASFKAWRQTTPTAYLRSVRLKLARDDLLQPGVETTVTDVALRRGFLHLGRFSSQYKEAFGESPGVTLRRGRGRRKGRHALIDWR